MRNIRLGYLWMLLSIPLVACATAPDEPISDPQAEQAVAGPTQSEAASELSVQPPAESDVFLFCTNTRCRPPGMGTGFCQKTLDDPSFRCAHPPNDSISWFCCGP